MVLAPAFGVLVAPLPQAELEVEVPLAVTMMFGQLLPELRGLRVSLFVYQ